MVPLGCTWYNCTTDESFIAALQADVLNKLQRIERLQADVQREKQVTWSVLSHQAKQVLAYSTDCQHAN